jgi:WD40 repeat protein
MPLQDDIDNQQQLLTTYRRTLAVYLQQLAQLGGSAFAPPGVLNGIDEVREQIRRCKATLRSWNVAVEDHPNDDPLPDTYSHRSSLRSRWWIPTLGIGILILVGTAIIRLPTQTGPLQPIADAVTPQTIGTETIIHPPQGSPGLPAPDDPLVHTIQLADAVNDVLFTPDGHRIFASSANETYIRVARVADGAVEDNFPAPGVTTMAFSPDGQILATADWGPELKLWSVADRQLFHRLNASAEPSSVAFAPPDGQILAIGLWDGSIQLWRIDQTKPFRILRGHTDGVTSIAFAPDGQILASGSKDTTVRLWRMTDDQLLETLRGHLGRIADVAFSSNGQLLASGSWDKTVKLWRTVDRTLQQTFDSPTGIVTSIALAPDGRAVAAGLDNGSVEVWRIGESAIPQILKGHTGRVDHLVFAADGQTLASGSNDRTVKLWHVKR